MRNVWNKVWQLTPGTGGKHEAFPGFINLNAQGGRRWRDREIPLSALNDGVHNLSFLLRYLLRYIAGSTMLIASGTPLLVLPCPS